MELTQKEKGVLLIAARDSISNLFTGIPAPSINYNYYPTLYKHAGAFVTLTMGGQLRGCIGYIFNPAPLFETVCEAARLAAMNDPRFVPLQKEELVNTEIEISVLSPSGSIRNYAEISIGKHGLILEEDGTKALLLPQVASDHNYDVPAFLSALCEKAGLDPYEWKKRHLPLKVFTADVFSEASNRIKTYVPD